MNELHALTDAVLHEQLRFDAGRVLLKRDPRHADDLPITHSSIRRSAHPSAADQRPLQAARSHAVSALRKSVCIEATVPRRVVRLPNVTEPRAHAREEYVHVEWREREHVMRIPRTGRLGRKHPAHSGRFQLGQEPSVACACCVQVPADLGMRRTERCHVEQIGAIARDQLRGLAKLVQLRRQTLPVTSHAPTPR